MLPSERDFFAVQTVAHGPGCVKTPIVFSHVEFSSFEYGDEEDDDGGGGPLDRGGT